MRTDSDRSFESAVLDHVDAAYNVARWILGDDQDAEDAVQEAALKAFNGFSRFKGANGKPWFLAIVRNACMDRARQRSLDRGVRGAIDADLTAPARESPDVVLLRSLDEETLWRALDCLPLAYREMIVMREFEDMSYREIATVTDLPIGTVMSRLARARSRLHAALLGSGIEVQP
ncbi:MAG: sigma-70 family RNA polymerase sigma factor [Fimbriimonadaceae bacterium]